MALAPAWGGRAAESPVGVWWTVLAPESAGLVQSPLGRYGGWCRRWCRWAQQRGGARLERVLEGCESLLRPCQVSGLESLTNRREVLSAVGAMESRSIAERTALPERYQRVIGLLRGGGVPGL